MAAEKPYWTDEPRTGVALLDQYAPATTDEDVFRYLYNHSAMSEQGRKIFDEINNDRQGNIVNRIQGVLIDPKNKDAFRGIWKVLTNASISQRNGQRTLLYSNPGMRQLYTTQAGHYSTTRVPYLGIPFDKFWMGKNRWWSYLPFGWGDKADDKVRDVVYNITAGNPDSVVYGMRDPADTKWEEPSGTPAKKLELPSNENGGMHYVTPALVAGAPLAILGGMMAKKRPLMTGIGILGAAGLAGAAYGMAKDKNWKGWAPVESLTASFDDMFRKKGSVEHGLTNTIDNATPSAYLAELALGGFRETTECPKCLPDHTGSSPADTRIH